MGQSCIYKDRRVFLSDGKIHINPTLKSLNENDINSVFLPYEGYLVQSFNDTIFDKTYLIFKYYDFYFGEEPLSEKIKVKGFATKLKEPILPIKNILEVFIRKFPKSYDIEEIEYINEKAVNIIFKNGFQLHLEIRYGYLLVISK